MQAPKLKPNNLICLQLAGSRAYGLEKEDSDYDWRGIYLADSPSSILGLERDNFKEWKKEGDDEFYWELRHFLKCVRAGNSGAIEMLYGKPLEEGEVWKLICLNRVSLFSAEVFYKGLSGYAYNEWRLTIGERTGQLGSKRFEAVKQYGFSPKNAVQLLRLLWSGTEFFRSGQFPLNVREFSGPYKDILLSIKFEPSKWTRDNIERLYLPAELSLKAAYEDSGAYRQSFNEALANELCFLAYKPLLDSFEPSQVKKS